MDVDRICSDLVKIRSDNPPGKTDEVIAYISSILENLGISSQMISGKPGLCNLISTENSSGLMFCGHVDVVPAIDEGWDYPPFSGIIADGFVHGRGSTDMKGGCAAILAALDNLVNNDREPAVDLAFVCDEEGGGPYGMQYLLAKKYISPRECLIAEPTPYASPAIGEKGLIRLNVTFRGQPGHSSLHPIVGKSAIIQACSFHHFIESFHHQEFPVDEIIKDAIITASKSLSQQVDLSPESAYRVLRHIMYNPGVIHGGERVNVVAQRCTSEIDMRIPWGCNPHQILERIREHFPDTDITVDEIAPASFTAPCRLLTETCRAIAEVYHEPATPCVTWAATDARHLREAGVHVIEYGPGDLARLHAVNEQVSISQLEKASEIFSRIMVSYMNSG